MVKRIVSMLVCMIMAAGVLPAYAHNEYAFRVTRLDDSVDEVHRVSSGMRRYKSKNGLYGYMDEDFNVVIEPKYKYAYGFSGSLAKVDIIVNELGMRREQYIDKNGDVQDMEYQSPPSYNENGVAIVSKDGETEALINDKGELLTEFKYSTIHPFYNGYAVAVLKEEENGVRSVLIDEKDFSEVVIDGYAGAWDVLKNGNIVVRDSEGYVGIVDKDHREVAPCIYKSMYSSDDSGGYMFSPYGGPYQVQSKDGKFGYIDENGKVVIPTIFDMMYEYNPGGLSPAAIDNHKSLINNSGEIVYDVVKYMGHDMYAVIEDGVKTKYVNAITGECYDKYDIDVVGPYVDGVSLAVKRIPDGDEETDDYDELKYGLVDMYGNIIRDFDIPIYDEVKRSWKRPVDIYSSYPYIISDKMIAVRIDGKWGYMDLTGNMVIEPMYDKADAFVDGYAEVELGKETFSIDKNNNRYEYVSLFGYEKYSTKVRETYDRCVFMDNQSFLYNNKLGCVDGYYLHRIDDSVMVADRGETILKSVGNDLADIDGNILIKDCCGGNEIKMDFIDYDEIVVEAADGKYLIEMTKTEAPDEIILTIGEKEAIYNGERCENDVAPMVKDGHIMLPIRFVAEKLGAEVGYVQKTNLVAITVGELQIGHIVGSDTALVGGVETKMDAPSYIENGRTYLPIEFIKKNIVPDAEWFSSNKQVRITVK